MTDLDNSLWRALDNSMTHTQSGTESKSKALKTIFSVPYVVSTYRGKSECEEGSLKARCITPTIEDATPISMYAVIVYSFAHRK